MHLRERGGPVFYEPSDYTCLHPVDSSSAGAREDRPRESRAGAGQRAPGAL